MLKAHIFECDGCGRETGVPYHSDHSIRRPTNWHHLSFGSGSMAALFCESCVKRLVGLLPKMGELLAEEEKVTKEMDRREKRTHP